MKMLIQLILSLKWKTFLDLNKFQFKIDETFTSVRRYFVYCDARIVINETTEWILLSVDSSMFIHQLVG